MKISQISGQKSVINIYSQKTGIKAYWTIIIRPSQAIRSIDDEFSSLLIKLGQWHADNES